MKLNELKTITPADLTPRQYKLGHIASTRKLIPKNAERIGEPSVYGIAYTTPDEPGTVTKVVRKIEDINKDAYFQYVSALAKNDRISNNPFFPRIYKIKVVKDKQGNDLYSVEMERLLPFETLSNEECNMIGERLFFNYAGFERDALAYAKEIASSFHRDALTTEGNAKFALLKAIEKCLRNLKEVATYIKDPKLKAALMILQSLLKKNKNFDADIHSGNIMIRRGPGGPQLVILDPIC